jgi:hypothetical protein
MARNSTTTMFYESRNVDEHVSVIGKYVEKSLRDPETIKLARKIVTARFDYVKDPQSGQQVAVVEAWGKLYRAPPGSACKARDGECEITRIWDFIVLNLRYTFDPQETDTFSTVKESLESGGGDCDDASIMFAALLKAIGFKVVLRVISTTGRNWEHIYALAGLPHEAPKRWIALDATVEGFHPGDEFKPYKSKRDFLV